LFAGYTVHPLRELLPDSVDSEQARASCSIFGGPDDEASKLRIFIWHGSEDQSFPVELAMQKYDALFEKL